MPTPADHAKALAAIRDALETRREGIIAGVFRQHTNTILAALEKAAREKADA